MPRGLLRWHSAPPISPVISADDSSMCRTCDDPVRKTRDGSVRGTGHDTPIMQTAVLCAAHAQDTGDHLFGVLA